MVVLVAAVAVAGVLPWWPRIAEPSTWAATDHQILWTAATALDEGLDPFDRDVLDAVGRRAGRDVTPFSASQPVAVALVGLASGDDHADSYRRWRALNVALLVAALAACAWLVADVAHVRGPGVLAARGESAFVRSGTRSVRIEAPDRSRIGGFVEVRQRRAEPNEFRWGRNDLRHEVLGPLPAAVAIFGLSEATTMSLWFNSWNPATAALLLVAAAAWRRAPAAAGAALGLAVVVKTSPALVVVFAAVVGARRVVGAAAVTWGAVTALGVAWLGVDVHVAWVERVVPRLGFAAVSEGDFNNALHVWNLAPNGLVTRAAFADGALGAAAWIAPVVAAACVAVALGVVFTAARRGRAAGAWAVAVAVTTSFLASSVTWPHHLIFGSVAWAWWLVAVPRAGALPRVLGVAALVALVVPLGGWGGDELDARVRTAGLVALWGAVLATPPRTAR